MGRKSALTPEQWVEIERRHLVGGESINSLAKAFKVDESTIRKKINPNKSEAGKTGKPLLALASEKVEAEKRIKDISAEISALPFVRQEIVHGLSRKLANISDHLASAAEYGSATAHRLTALANSEVAKIDDANPLGNIEALKGVAVLTKLANDSSQIGVNLMAANKEVIKDMNTGKSDDPGLMLAEIAKLLPN